MKKTKGTGGAISLLLVDACYAVAAALLLTLLLTSSTSNKPPSSMSNKHHDFALSRVTWAEDVTNQSVGEARAVQHLLGFLNQPHVLPHLPNVTLLDISNLNTVLNTLHLQQVHLPPWVRATAANLLESHTVVRKKRVIDEEDEEQEAEGEAGGDLKVESRTLLMVVVPELPNVDIGRILELYRPDSGFNSYERRALKDIIDFVRTKTFLHALTKLDSSSALYATLFQITRGQFLKKLMTFVRGMNNMDREIIKATEILEHCIDHTFDNDMVEQDVLNELDEMDETNGRLVIREELVAVLNNASREVVTAAEVIRKFLRTPDLRFGLLFRGLNYALNELTLEQRLGVLLMRLKSYMKTTLTKREIRAIDTLMDHLQFDQYKELTNTNAMDVYESIGKTKLPKALMQGYKNILNIGAIDELRDLKSFSDIEYIFKLGFTNDTNIAILLRTLCIQFLMSLPPDRENAEIAQGIYNFLFSSQKNVALYDAPQVIFNEVERLVQIGEEISPVVIPLFNKVRILFEKYGPIFSSDLDALMKQSSGLELLIRSLNFMKMRLPQKEKKIWVEIQRILDNIPAKQDYEPSLPSEYNFADEFTIACRLSNIQKQFKVNTIAQIIAHKNEMLQVFRGMYALRQLPIRVRIIILLNRIDRLDFPYLTQQFKFQLRGIIHQLIGDDEIQEVYPFDLKHLKVLFDSSLSSIRDENTFKRFNKVFKYLLKNPQQLDTIQRGLVLIHDYAPRRQLTMLLRELHDNRMGLNIPENIINTAAKCLQMFNSNKRGDEQYIMLQSTLFKVMQRVFSGSGIEHEKVTKQVIEARETLKELYSAGIIDLKYLLRDIRLHKYTDRTQFLILLYRTATIKKLFTDTQLYKKYGQAVRTLINYFGIDLNDIKAEAVDLPEDIKDLLETALPESMITTAVLRARIVLVRALETNVIDRRIAYDGIQCYARSASPRKKLEYIIKNVWPIRADIPLEISSAIRTIKDFLEMEVDNDTEHPINIYSFDFQEVFDDVITHNEPQPIIKAKEIMYLDFETHTGRYRHALSDFVRGKKYPIQEIGRMIAEAIVNKVPLTRKADTKVLAAAKQILQFLQKNDLHLERVTSIEQLLTGNAQNYVG